MTTGQLAALLRRLRIDLDPDDAHHRYETAIGRRRVVSEATAEGTANLLGLDLAPHRVAAATRRINRIARRLHTTGETRTMDQLRADVVSDLLNGKTVTGTGSDQAVVDIQVDLDTLTGLTQHSGDLDGYGPVIADIARQVTTHQHDAEWRFTVTHPESGMPIHVGATQRRPDAPHLHAPPDRSPLSDLCLPRLSYARPGLRPRPSHPLGPRRTHQSGLSGPAVPPRPPHPPPRLELPTPPQRRPPLDQPPQTHLHHQRHTPLAETPNTSHPLDRS